MSTKTMSSFASLLESINNPKVKTIIESTENFQETQSRSLEEDLSEYIVTDGWGSDEISILESHYGEEDAYDILSESIFGGTPNHIIKSLVHSDTSPAGEGSAVKSTVASNKSHVYNHLTSEENAGGHHVVKHNGKVIASMHPADHNTNTKYNLHDEDPSFKSKPMPKGAAFQHIYSSIEKHGGFKGHNVEVHTYKADSTRDAKSNERITNKLSQDKPKSFSDIAARASDKFSEKHSEKGSVEHQSKNHNRKISHRMKSLNANFAEAQKSGDYDAMVKHAGDLHDLVKNHPKNNKDEINNNKKEAAEALKAHNRSKGRDKDSGMDHTIASKHHNEKLSALVKAVKEEQEGYDLAMNEAYQPDLFPVEKKAAEDAGGGLRDSKNKSVKKAVETIFKRKDPVPHQQPGYKKPEPEKEEERPHPSWAGKKIPGQAHPEDFARYQASGGVSTTKKFFKMGTKRNFTKD